jgi:hypothetical protein
MNWHLIIIYKCSNMMCATTNLDYIMLIVPKFFIIIITITIIS